MTKKKVESEPQTQELNLTQSSSNLGFTNIGTHIPYYYGHGPNKGNNPKKYDEELYLEKDEINPNQVIYDLENNKVIIPNSDDEVNNNTN
jgi:hypothetical protein